MAPAKGILTLDDLTEKVHSGDIETVLVVFPDIYGRFMGKRVPGAFFLDSVAGHGMHACTGLHRYDGARELPHPTPHLALVSPMATH